MEQSFGEAFDDEDFELDDGHTEADAQKKATRKAQRVSIPEPAAEAADLPRFTEAVLRNGHIAIDAGKELSLAKLAESIKRVRDSNPGNSDVRSEATRWLTEMLGFSTLDASLPAAGDIDDLAGAAASRLDEESKQPLMKSAVAVNIGRNSDENSQAVAALQRALHESTDLGKSGAEEQEEPDFTPEDVIREIDSTGHGGIGADSEAGI